MNKGFNNKMTLGLAGKNEVKCARCSCWEWQDGPSAVSNYLWIWHYVLSILNIEGAVATYPSSVRFPPSLGGWIHKSGARYRSHGSGRKRDFPMQIIFPEGRAGFRNYPGKLKHPVIGNMGK